MTTYASILEYIVWTSILTHILVVFKHKETYKPFNKALNAINDVKSNKFLLLES